MTSAPPSSLPRFAVWFDLSCDDFMALEANDMTDPLRGALEKEGVEIHYVHALTRKEAIKKAFPTKPLIATALLSRPSPGRRLH